MISGTKLSNCKVVVMELDDSNIGGCHHDTEVINMILKMLILRKDSKQQPLN